MSSFEKSEFSRSEVFYRQKPKTLTTQISELLAFLKSQSKVASEQSLLLLVSSNF